MNAGFWFLDREHKQCGPVGEEEFVRLIRAGTIGRETQMWTAGMSEWRMAGQVDRFAPLFGVSGPPAVPIDGRTASASPTGTSSANPKLPLWDTIRLSYSTYFDHFPDVLRICWLWLVLIVPLTGIANWLRFSWIAGAAADLKRGTPPQAPAHLALMPAEVMALGYGAGLVSMLAGVSIAVAWHRRIILGEHPGLSAGNIATKRLWRYVLVGLAIGLIVILPASVVIVPTFLLLSPAATGKAQGFLMVIPVMFLLAVVAYATVLRLSLLLPARAVGDLGLTFKETWIRTRGNTWRIFWGIVVCAILPVLAAQVVFFSLVGFGPGMSVNEAFIGRMAVATTILSFYHLLILPIGIGFLSLSYWHFFRRT